MKSEYTLVSNGKGYVALFYRNKKVGYLDSRLLDEGKYRGYLKISIAHIDAPHRGKKLGYRLYSELKKISGAKGICSYLPDRTNKKQIPKIYSKMGNVRTEEDYQFIDFTPNYILED